MTTKILTTAILLSAFTANAQWWGGKKIKGNGNLTTITRTTTDYDGIKCAGSFDYVLVKGTEGQLTLKGESNLLSYIVTKVKNGKLIVKTKDNAYLKPSYNKQIVITIPFKDINQVSLSGSGDLNSEDIIETDHLDVSMAGSGDLKAKVKANSIDGSMAGSGDLTLIGETNTLEASLAGSGDIHAYRLQAEDVDVSVAGSGDAEIVCNNRLKARVAGSGDIEYKGNPKYEDTKVSGSGSISN